MTVQLEVSLQVLVAQVSEVQVMAVPTQVPSPLHVSLKVQGLPSLHAVVDGLGVTVQLDVPLHARVLHASSLQVIGVPLHMPLELHWSAKVQALPSLHAVPVGACGLEHIPVDGSQVPATWH